MPDFSNFNLHLNLNLGSGYPVDSVSKQPKSVFRRGASPPLAPSLVVQFACRSLSLWLRPCCHSGNADKSQIIETKSSHTQAPPQRLRLGFKICV